MVTTFRVGFGVEKGEGVGVYLDHVVTAVFFLDMIVSPAPSLLIITHTHNRQQPGGAEHMDTSM